VVTIDGQQSLQQAALLMREQHVGALVVTSTDGEGARVAGIVTDRDLAIDVLARGGSASQVPVGRLVAGRLVSVPEDAELAEAASLMLAAGVRRLLVQNAEAQLVGLVSFDDMLPACVAPLAMLAQVLGAGREREAAERGAIASGTRPVVRVPSMGTAGWTTAGWVAPPRA
jgi:signal-transduction protein with cAMP-binding, CBS, and nucleotidyltransferase domain